MDRTLWSPKSNVTNEKRIVCRFFVDVGNAPTFVAADNQYVASIVRTSQGLYTITLLDTFRRFIGGLVSMQLPAAPGASYDAYLGPVANVGTSTPVTAAVLILNSAGAVADPGAANANNSITVELIFSDMAAS